MQLGVRFYDPQVGRFTQRDPIRNESLVAYGYVGNKPLVLIDPDGHKAIKLCYYPGGVLGSGSHAWICLGNSCWGLHPSPSAPIATWPGQVQNDQSYMDGKQKCSTVIVSECVYDCLQHKIAKAMANPPLYNGLSIVGINCARWVSNLLLSCGYSTIGTDIPSDMPWIASQANDGQNSNLADRWCDCARKNGWK